MSATRKFSRFKFDFKDTLIRYYCASSQIELNELHYRHINSSSLVTPYIFLQEMPAIHIISQDSLSIPTNEDFELSSSDLTKLFHRDSYLKDQQKTTYFDPRKML